MVTVAKQAQGWGEERKGINLKRVPSTPFPHQKTRNLEAINQ
jgi:hypothetical protein